MGDGQIKKIKSINILELLVIKFTIKSFFKECENGHVRIMSNNVTAAAYINNMGGCKSPSSNKMAHPSRQ